MTTRTTTRTATFAKPFSLGDDATMYPAGRYLIDTDEELLENLSFVAYRRTATFITVPSGPGSSQTITIDPADLEDALMSDEGLTRPATADTKDAPASKTGIQGESADRIDHERADNEGMIAR